MILKKDDSLFAETNRYWRAISACTYDFGRTQRIADSLGKLTLEDVIGFYDRYLAVDGPERRKIASWAQGENITMGHKFVPEGNGPGAMTGQRNGGVNATNNAIEDGQQPTEETSLIAREMHKADRTKARGERELVVIDDISDFHECMPLSPAWTPSEVEVNQPAAAQ